MYMSSYCEYELIALRDDRAKKGCIRRSQHLKIVSYGKLQAQFPQRNVIFYLRYIYSTVIQFELITPNVNHCITDTSIFKETTKF